ncbi:hypothetical protein JTE90_022515 [Oedothorax gibbosus]|uniref:Uncharacterized protein n=1 Tax=Oedothorax gibbosus TaxID=931172 RepID=A0AAV6UZ32_9ARAC|nr:hypothetical protein JTE90_022515 [Oedothorax gibbosus]
MFRGSKTKLLSDSVAERARLSVVSAGSQRSTDLRVTSAALRRETLAGETNSARVTRRPNSSDHIRAYASWKNSSAMVSPRGTAILLLKMFVVAVENKVADKDEVPCDPIIITEVPGEKWTLIKIKKRLYETDDLVKARKKAREAEIESDLLTDDPPEDTSSQRKSKRKLIQFSPQVSDDGSSESEPQRDLDIIHMPDPPSCNLLDQPLFNNIGTSNTTNLPSQPVNTPIAESSPLRHYHSDQPTHNIGSSPIYLPSQRVYTPTTLNGPIHPDPGFKVLRRIENLTEVVQENNKLLHALLVEKKAAEDSPQVNKDCPFTLPLQSIKDVEDIEDLLKDSDKT